MWAYGLSSLRVAAAAPATWLVLVLGGLAGWVGLSLSVLALGGGGPRPTEIALSTSQAVAAALALWWIARLLEDDAGAGFSQMTDQTRPGPAGRILGRWLGAVGIACLGGWAVLIAVASHGDVPRSLSLYTAIIWPAACLGAWGALLGVRGAGALAVGGGAALWILGHLPWGTPALLPGPLGRLLAASLPRGPALAGATEAGGYTAAAVCGLLMLALALAPRPGAEA